MPRIARQQWTEHGIVPFGFLDGDGVWVLPIHQPVEGNDFQHQEWRDSRDGIAPLVCALCSYDQRNGQPRKAVTWPCKAAREGSTDGVSSAFRMRVIPRNVTGQLPSVAPYTGLYRPLILKPVRSFSVSTSVFSYAVSLLPQTILRKIGLLRHSPK